jgi:hypothetical protein
VTPEAAAAILGVEIDADRVSIEAAFRRIAKRTHPDRFAGGDSARLHKAAAQFDQASRARESLLGMARTASPTPQRAPAPASHTPTQPRPVNHRERAIIVSAAVALFLTIGAVLTVGLLPDAGEITTRAASSFDDPTKDPLHGLNVIQITDIRTIERQRDGRSTCWLSSVASKRSCARGIVTIDFSASAGKVTPTETITQDVGLVAGKPSFVTASRRGFPETRARISRFVCNS